MSDDPEVQHMDCTPVCGQLKKGKICQRTWFHEGDHIAPDQRAGALTTRTTWAGRPVRDHATAVAARNVQGDGAV